MQQGNTNHFFDDLVKFLTIFFKYKWMILIIFFTISAVSVIKIKQMPTLYEAKATILVKLGHEFMYRPGTKEGGTQLLMSQEEALTNEIKILQNKDLIKSVIASIGVQNIYPDPKKPKHDTAGNDKKMPKDSAADNERMLDVTAIRFEGNLMATAVAKSNIVEVSFKHEDPVMAAKALNILIEKYKDKHIDVYRDPKSTFLEEQASAFSDKLRQVEDKLQSFKQQNQVYSLDEQRSAFLQQRIALDTALKTTHTQIREIEEKIAFVKSSRWSTIAIMDTKSQLRKLQQKEQELLQRYTENSRVVQGIRKEIQAMEGSVVGPLEDARAIELSRLQGDLNALKAKADGLQRQISQISGEVRALDLREKEYLNLKREYGTQEASYKTYHQTGGVSYRR